MATENVKKNLLMMGALLGVVVLLCKLKSEAAITQLIVPETAAPSVPSFRGFDTSQLSPFDIPYLQSNPGLMDNRYGDDPFDKVFNVTVDDRSGSEKYIPIFGFVGPAPSTRDAGWGKVARVNSIGDLLNGYIAPPNVGDASLQ